MSKLIFASCVWCSDRAYYWVCVLIKDIGRRFPLELQCSLYQGQQDDVSQSVRGNHKTRFRGGQNLTAVAINASVYQVYPARRITGEGRAEFLRAWGFEQEGVMYVVLPFNSIVFAIQTLASVFFTSGGSDSVSWPCPYRRAPLSQFFRKMKNTLHHSQSEIDQKGFFDQNSALQAACDTSIARITGCAT